MSLKERMMSMNQNEGIPFMKGRTKGEVSELLGQVVTIRDFDFLDGQDGTYVVFVVDEIGDSFFFGGSVLTNNLNTITPEEKEEVKKNGLPVLMYEAKSKKTGRKYTGVKFYPDEAQEELPF